jgi:L-lysine 2,3-aminomutase
MVIRKLASMNRLTVVKPLRLEIETQLLHSFELSPEHTRIVKALGRRGITLYCNIPLFAFINDAVEEVADLTSSCRRIGIEINHMYVAGHPLQREWSRKHPIYLSQIVDIASSLRRNGSGRELPRYVIRTELGEVEVGLTSQALSTDESDNTLLKLFPYNLEYYRRMDPNYEFPKEVDVDEEGYPIVPVSGLII